MTTSGDDSGKVVRITSTSWKIEGVWPEIKYHLTWWLGLFWGSGLLAVAFAPERAIQSALGGTVYVVVLVPLIVGLLHLVARLRGRRRTLVITAGRVRTRRWVLIALIAFFGFGVAIGPAVHKAIEQQAQQALSGSY